MAQTTPTRKAPPAMSALTATILATQQQLVAQLTTVKYTLDHLNLEQQRLMDSMQDYERRSENIERLCEHQLNSVDDFVRSVKKEFDNLHAKIPKMLQHASGGLLSRWLALCGGVTSTAPTATAATAALVPAVPNESECSVCKMTREETWVFPCGHASTCAKCTIEIIHRMGRQCRCPICNTISDYPPFRLFVDNNKHADPQTSVGFFPWAGTDRVPHQPPAFGFGDPQTSVGFFPWTGTDRVPHH